MLFIDTFLFVGLVVGNVEIFLTLCLEGVLRIILPLGRDLKIRLSSDEAGRRGFSDRKI